MSLSTNVVPAVSFSETKPDFEQQLTTQINTGALPSATGEAAAGPRASPVPRSTQDRLCEAARPAPAAPWALPAEQGEMLAVWAHLEPPRPHRREEGGWDCPLPPASRPGAEQRAHTVTRMGRGGEDQLPRHPIAAAMHKWCDSGLVCPP